MSKGFESVDALVAAVGQQLGSTDWVEISQEDVNKFADATRAHEWIHVDTERARTEGPFGTTVAHGYLTLSLATSFLTELLITPGLSVGVNYGLNRVRFPAPVPVGSRVRAAGTLVDARRVGEGGVRTVTELRYEREGGDKMPCVAEVVSLILP